MKKTLATLLLSLTLGLGVVKSQQQEDRYPPQYLNCCVNMVDENHGQYEQFKKCCDAKSKVVEYDSLLSKQGSTRTFLGSEGRENGIRHQFGDSLIIELTHLNAEFTITSFDGEKLITKHDNNNDGVYEMQMVQLVSEGAKAWTEQLFTNEQDFESLDILTQKETFQRALETSMQMRMRIPLTQFTYTNYKDCEGARTYYDYQPLQQSLSPDENKHGMKTIQLYDRLGLGEYTQGFSQYTLDNGDEYKISFIHLDHIDNHHYIKENKIEPDDKYIIELQNKIQIETASEIQTETYYRYKTMPFIPTSLDEPYEPQQLNPKLGVKDLSIPFIDDR